MKKILFHGNCQTCAISRWFEQNYSTKYQFINCTEANLAMYWSRSNPTFALWTPPNVKKLQNTKTRKAVQEKIREADIFVFMHHTTNIDELNTVNLHDNVARGLKICLPNNRFSAYPICSRSLKIYLEYIRQNITKDPVKIAEYIKNEDDPVFTELLYTQYPFEGYTEKSLSQNPSQHEKCVELYDKVIPINDFVEKNWKDHLLFSSLNHPTEMYYRELISRLLTLLGEDLDLLERTENIEHPKGERTGEFININEFAFFKKHAPNLIMPRETGTNQMISFNGIFAPFKSK